MTTRILAILALLASASGVARAETLLLDDGTTRTGQILATEHGTVRMLVTTEGIRGEWAISISRVAAIVNADGSVPALRGVAHLSPNQHAIPAALARRADLPALRRLAQAAAAEQPAAPQPAAPQPAATAQQLEQLAQTAQAQVDDPKALLNTLTTLAHACPDAGRLNQLAQSLHGSDFGQWLADTRWTVVKPQAVRGHFDLRGVTEQERPALIEIMRAQTLAAVTPLRTFMPAPDTFGGPAAHDARTRINPLYNVTLENCQQVRKQALLATAVLRAQLELEPAMPPEDARSIRADLGDIYPVLDRATRGSRLVDMRMLALARWGQRH